VKTPKHPCPVKGCNAGPEHYVHAATAGRVATFWCLGCGNEKFVLQMGQAALGGRRNLREG
jgi:hypothetical protein